MRFVVREYSKRDEKDEVIRPGLESLFDNDSEKVTKVLGQITEARERMTQG